MNNIISQPTPLVYPDISGNNQYTNILLINNLVQDYLEIVNSVNTSTFPIVYSINSSKTELLTLLHENFNEISRIGICFASSSGSTNSFLDGEMFFLNNETMPYSDNLQFIINVINEFQVKNIDYLACDTLNYSNWTNYYDIIISNTNVTVGASNNQTGNIKYGGDWVLENTCQDVEFMYFTQNIEYYSYLLDNPSLATSAQGINGANGIVADTSGYIYVCNFSISNINKISISNPTTDFSTNWVSLANGGISDVVINNNYLYCSNYGNNKIVRVSLTNPATDICLNWATSTQGVGLVYSLLYYNNYIYAGSVGSGSNSNISKISITNPTTDFSANWATYTQLGGAPIQMTTDGNYLYAYMDIHTIARISLTNPTTIFTLNWATSTQGINSTGYGGGCVIDGNYLYATNSVNSSISKIGLSSPSTDFSANWATTANGLSSPGKMCIRGGYLYVANTGNNTVSQISLPVLPFILQGIGGYGSIIGYGNIYGTYGS